MFAKINSAQNFFHFFRPLSRPIPLNGYVADLIQIFFFLRYFRIHLGNCFPSFHSRSRLFLSFPQIFQRASRRKSHLRRTNRLLFIVVCAVDRSGSLFSSGIETLSHVISDKSLSDDNRKKAN